MLPLRRHDSSRGHDPERRRGRLRGQTETIGIVLILSLTIVGATIAFAVGATTVTDTTDRSNEEVLRTAFTQLDSTAARVGLGDSKVQQVSLPRGSYSVDPNAGRISVTHENHTGSGDTEVLYNDTLGAVISERDGVTFAYQGGGVWQSEGAGSSMVSPPELHYRDGTLTLPMIRILGSDDAAGTVTASISRGSSLHRIYPNESATYEAGSEPYRNPVTDGNITITIVSDYYRAWADYFRTRTDGAVTVDAANQTVAVTLVSRGTVGAFDMPADGNVIELRGLGDGHPIQEFTLTLRPDDEDSADFSNLQWSLYAEEGSREFEINLRSGAENDDPATDDCTERYVKATVYYSGSNGDPYHGWSNDTAFTTACDDLNGDGDNETYLEVDLTGTTELAMDGLASDQLLHFSATGDSLTDPINFSEHEGEPNADWEPTEFSTSVDDDTTIGNLTNHYLALLGPNVDLTVEDPASNTVEESDSSGTLRTSGDSRSSIAFLHITENQIEVELEP